MAGKELKSSDKTVLKYSRDGVLEKKLTDQSETRVSRRTEEAVLKTEALSDIRFDNPNTEKVAPHEPARFKSANLRLSRTDLNQTEQQAEVRNETEEQTSQSHHNVDFNANQSERELLNFEPDSSNHQSRPPDDLAGVETEKYRLKESKLTEEDSKSSKLKEKKVRNTLQEKSSAAEKLTADENSSALNFESDNTENGYNAAQNPENQTELSKTERRNGKKYSKLVEHDEKRVDRIDRQITKAEDNLRHQRVLHAHKEFNPEKGKVQRKLRFEKEVKPLNNGSAVAKGIKSVQGAMKAGISGSVHNEINKYAENDTTLKAAHGTEKTAESALRFVKESVKAHHQQLKEKPYEKVSKLKFQHEIAVQKLNEHKALMDAKQLHKDENEARKSSLKKSQQKIQRKKNQKKSAEKTAKSAKDKAEKAVDVVIDAITANKMVIIVIALFLAIFVMFGIVCSILLSSLSGTGEMIIGSTYTSEDGDIYAANNYMNSLEAQLNETIANIPNDYAGWDEYNYYLDPIGHDPYALTSYLTAMELAFKFDSATISRIEQLFNALYTLELESVHEVRSYEYTIVDEDGNEEVVTETYDYYILNVTLTANDWDSVVKPQLEAAGVYDIYLLLQENHGNRPDLF